MKFPTRFDAQTSEYSEFIPQESTAQYVAVRKTRNEFQNLRLLKIFSIA
jgi:hypothetical protein